MPSNNYIYKMSNAGGMSTLARYTDMLAGNTTWNPWEPAGAYESIVSLTSSGSTNLIEFTSIPSTYAHLQVRIFSRSARSAADDTVYIRLNSDSSSSYSWHRLRGDGSSASAGGYYPDGIMFAGATPGASATSGIFGTSVVDILDYKNTSKNKTIRSLGGYDANGSGMVELYSGSWNSTAAVTSLTFANYASGNNFVAGTIFALYGIKG
jgi:hypothetical protein